MSQNIASRTISAVTDQRLVLTNGQATRLFGFLTTWNQVRLGIQYSFNNSANMTGTPRLAFGICAGTAKGYGDNPAHFLGLRSNGSTWTYNAGSPNYSVSNGGWTQCKVIGTTITDLAGAVGSCRGSSSPTSARTALILDITRGSPFSVDFGFPNSTAAVQTDVTDTNFLNMMELGTLSNINTIVSGYATAGAATTTIDEVTNGALNALCAYYDKTAQGLEISAVRIRKIS